MRAHVEHFDRYSDTIDPAAPTEPTNLRYRSERGVEMPANGTSFSGLVDPRAWGWWGDGARWSAWIHRTGPILEDTAD